MHKMTLLLALLAASATACGSPTTPITRPNSLVTALDSPPAPDILCADGPDATLQVQAAMVAAQCLLPGTYSIDAPALGPSGRRRDAMLTGGTLCGVREAQTIVRFRGDAHQLFWVGVLNANVHGVRLDSSCLTNTIEQTHLVRATVGVAIQDAVLAHPTRATLAGDDVNVVGSTAAPVVGLVVDHVVFESCARFGVQMSGHAVAPRISDNTFGEGCGIGSEGAGDLTDVTISHNTFRGMTRLIALNLQRMTRLSLSRNQIHGHGAFVLACDDCRVEHNVIDSLGPWDAGDFTSAIHVADVAHRLLISDNVIDQAGTASAPAILIGPMRTNRQADLVDLEVSDNSIRQATGAPFVAAIGVTGLRVLRNQLDYVGTSAPTTVVAGPAVATPPAVDVPSTGVQEADNVVQAVN
jgi:hypothetical protein